MNGLATLALIPIASLVACSTSLTPTVEVFPASAASLDSLGVAEWHFWAEADGLRLDGTNGDELIASFDIAFLASDQVETRSRLADRGIERFPDDGFTSTLSDFDAEALRLFYDDVAAARNRATFYSPISACYDALHRLWEDCNPFPDVEEVAKDLVQDGLEAGMTDKAKKLFRRLRKKIPGINQGLCGLAVVNLNRECQCSALSCLNECFHEQNGALGECRPYGAGFDDCVCTPNNGSGQGGGGGGFGTPSNCTIGLGELCPAECSSCTRQPF